MGIIKAFTGAAGGTMADQWLEMYCCDSIPQGILAYRGKKQVSERSSNTKGDENVVSDGSVIVVNEGQSALAVQQGKVIGCYTQPGEHIFHGGSASLFSGGGVKGIGKEIFQRVGFGGDVAIHQFILYIDMKEQMGNPFSVSFPICVTDEEIGLQLTAAGYAKGVFSFRITDPMTFYQRIFRGANGTMSVQDVLPQLQAEFATAMTEAAGNLFAGSLRLSDMPGKVAKIADEVSRCMTEKWVGLRGFTVVSTAMESLTVCDKDRRIIQTIERAKINRDPAMAAATVTTAQADAMTDAARNESGGLFTVSAVYPAASVHPSPLPNVPSAPTAQKIPNVSAAPNPQPTQNIFLEPDDSEKPRLWYCPNCRKMLTSKFCPDCGAKRKK
ncbi:MAG: SPFH domain-containing protein [Clostridia bacterium]|nr:SPFH domain-containing protein [Clostridia bacterium]